jgi:hypothetical protein
MEEMMKRNLWIGVTALVLVVPCLYGSQYVQGTVADVQKHRVYSPESTMGGSNPSDAPLTSRYYAFEVSVRVDCRAYVGRYETPFNYLPSAFIPDQPIQLRLTKHVMYFDLPNDPDMRMGIMRRSSNCGHNR